MTTDIFIRTYKNDLEWLKYCLRSIAKYVTGYRQIIICIPEDQKHLLDGWGFSSEKIVSCPVYERDYLGQQISKMKAFEHTDAEAVIFIDSDCCFNKPVDLSEELFENGKPIIYKTLYEKVGDAICWKSITEKTIGQPLEFEYMRRLPFVFLTKTLKSANLFIKLQHNVDTEVYVMDQPGRHFSEFNYLGAYADKFEPENYCIKDTEKDGHGNMYLKQFWSWSGLKPEEREELEVLTK